jgi:lipopolysaccharide export system protein LptC
MRYTRFVAFGKHTLWILIAFILTTVIWIVSDNTGDNGSRIVFSNAPKMEVLENVMTKPHYQGVDVNNQPFTVIADKAVQKDKNIVDLENISADMMRADGKWLALKALSGQLDNQKKHMTLVGGVSLFYEGGIEFNTKQAYVDMAGGRAYGDSPVQGQGPMGTITANSFEVLERGKSIRFNGSVRMKLYR